MTLPRLLVAVRRRWRVRVVARSLAAAWTVAVGIALLLLAADVALDPAAADRRALRWVPLAALALILVAALRKAFPGPGDARLALLVDERTGTDHVCSTLLSSKGTLPVESAFRQRAEARVGALRPEAVVPIDAAWTWSGALAGTAVAVILVATMGGGTYLHDRWLSPMDAVDSSPSGPASAPAASAGDLPTLRTLTYSVQPPAYTGQEEVGGDLGAVLTVLPGAVVEIRGDGTARAPELSVEVVGGSTPALESADRGWVVRWTVEADQRAVAVSVGSVTGVLDRRVVPLRVLRDRAPEVTLERPSADVVQASAAGTVTIRAQASDDHGVRAMSLRWVRSRGSGESFDFDEGVWPWDRTDRTGDGMVATHELDLAELGLERGDVVHVRATAEDGNDVTGPGRGASSTRQIRIVGGDDLVQVTTLVGFPIEREREPILSQRMVILLTEELIEGTRSLSANSVVGRAGEIADEQARLRARVGEQIFSRATTATGDPEAHLEFEEGETEAFLDELEGIAEAGPLIDPVTGIATISDVEIPAHDHDSDPIIAVNRGLLEVYNHMWDAERQLRLAALEESLAPQYAALEELQRIRESERVFARGRVGVAPIDVPATRGTGEVDEARPAPRHPAATAEVGARLAVARIDELLSVDPPPTGQEASVAMADLSLELLRSGGALDAGEALAGAASAAAAGAADDVTMHLADARSVLLSVTARTGPAMPSAPATWAGARYAGSLAAEAFGLDPAAPLPGAGSTARPFVFATARYESGDWDSAPLVPNNLIHSLARYTELEVASEGVVVDLGSPEALEYPFLYLTGHLPVFFNQAESRNLVEFVERGGMIFIDDHNHDIDGAFHTSVTAELARLFGDDALRPVPSDHELYRSFFVFDDGPPVTGHELSGWGDGLIHRELYQIELGGRIGVLYSNKDYSSEWSYHSENKRFQAVDNTRFGVNILVYALTR